MEYWTWKCKKLNIVKALKKKNKVDKEAKLTVLVKSPFNCLNSLILWWHLIYFFYHCSNIIIIGCISWILVLNNFSFSLTDGYDREEWVSWDIFRQWRHLRHHPKFNLLKFLKNVLNICYLKYFQHFVLSSKPKSWMLRP